MITYTEHASISPEEAIDLYFEQQMERSNGESLATDWIHLLED